MGKMKESAVTRIALERTDARRRFARNAAQIVLEWKQRQDRADDAESKSGDCGEAVEDANRWFKRNAYFLLKRMIENQMDGVFLDVASADGRISIPKAMAANPFSVELKAMGADPRMLSRVDRNAWARQMLYAYLHDVPSRFLVGFIHASGNPSAIADKLSRGVREPGFVLKARRTSRAQKMAS